MTKTRQGNDVTNCIGVVDTKTELNYQGLSNWARYGTKTRQDNNMIDSTHGSLALKAYQQNLYLKYYY